MKQLRTFAILFAISFATALTCYAELIVQVGQPKIVGQKVIVPLAFKNGLTEKVDSARAVIFLLNEKGKMVAQATRWVIGGSQEKQGLEAGATNIFNFVIANEKPFTTTNLTTKVSFSRVVLEGGKLADIAKQVKIQQQTKQ